MLLLSFLTSFISISIALLFGRWLRSNEECERSFEHKWEAFIYVDGICMASHENTKGIDRVDIATGLFNTKTIEEIIKEAKKDIDRIEGNASSIDYKSSGYTTFCCNRGWLFNNN